MLEQTKMETGMNKELTPEQRLEQQKAQRQADAEDRYIKENFGRVLCRAKVRKNQKQTKKRLKRVGRKVFSHSF